MELLYNDEKRATVYLSRRIEESRFSRPWIHDNSNRAAPFCWLSIQEEHTPLHGVTYTLLFQGTLVVTVLSESCRPSLL